MTELETLFQTINLKINTEEKKKQCHFTLNTSDFLQDHK